MDEQILLKYEPANRGNLIAILQDVQNAFGYLPENVIQKVADYLKLPLSSVYGVATFYNQFRLKPLGKMLYVFAEGQPVMLKNLKIFYLL